MPSRTFITRKEVSTCFKATMDRLTLLLGANESGDLKMKPVLIYHSEKCLFLKKNAKHTLLVLYK